MQQIKIIGVVVLIGIAFILGAAYLNIQGRTIGGQKDSHGCLIAAGYSWCEAKNTCIRQWEEYCTAAAQKTVTFACSDSKTIIATFYLQDDKFVDLKLIDGRNMSIPHAISASGARYAKSDESFVFWNKGDTAFVTEGATSSVETYSNCVLQSEGSMATSGLECHDSSRYFAVQKSLSDSVGSNILIKYKTSPSQSFPCAYTVASGDFEIKNVQAEYFLTFTDNFLVLDSGTAPPPRGLVVYDLRSRTIVFIDSYTKPVTVAGDTITYLSKTDQKPTLQNCPNLNDYTANSLGAVIMSKVTVDLPSLNKKDLGVFECMATQ